MVASLLRQLAHTIMLRSNIDQYPNFPSPFHAPTFQSTVLYTLHHFSNPQTIWKYNALFHLASEYSTGTTPPIITGQLLVDILVPKKSIRDYVMTVEPHVCRRVIFTCLLS